MAEDDILWSRPDPETAQERDHAGYDGPPVGTPAPPDWHPPQQDQVAPPRQLPPIDHEATGQAELRASKVTYAIGLAAAVVLVLIACSKLI